MNIASTLLWVLGVLNFLGSVALGIPQIAKGKSAPFLIYICIIGIAACVTGYLLRKKRRYAGIGAVVVSILSFVSPPFIGLIIGPAVILLIATKWKELL